MMHSLPRVDVMVAYSCNLSCQGCISISDIKRDGVEPYDIMEHWITAWASKIRPDVVTVFGGEPLIHPRITDVCVLLRNAWPESTLRFITNGYLLHRVKPEFWFELGNFEMQVSIHRKDHEPVINQLLKNILLVRPGWKVSQHGGEHHKQIQWKNSEFSLYKSIFKDFVVPYKSGLRPWHSDPAQAHKICGAPDTPVLYKGRLYKCPPVANIQDITGQHYQNYQGLSPLDDLDAFIGNINKPEPICGFCPDQSRALIINHFDHANVTVKQHI